MSCPCAAGSSPVNGKCCKSTSIANTSATAVPLPRALSTSSGIEKPKQPLWPVHASTSPEGGPDARRLSDLIMDPKPLAEKCGSDEREDHACCRDLKPDDDRRLINPEVVRDVIIGLSDGLTVPFALTAGLSGLGSSRLVVTAGLAELCAGAISMGIGGYLASKAELDHYHYLRYQTRARVGRSCSGEMEREVHDILAPLGVEEPLSRLLAQNLRGVEDRLAIPIQADRELSRTFGSFRRTVSSWVHGRAGGKDSTGEEGAVARSAEDGEKGLTAFLLKFGEGMEEVPRSRLYTSAITIGLSYFVGGLIPLIPYFTDITAREGLIISSCVTGLVLFIFGAFKTYFTGATGGWAGYLYGAVSTTIVGAMAAGTAYGLVVALHVQE